MKKKPKLIPKSDAVAASLVLPSITPDGVRTVSLMESRSAKRRKPSRKILRNADTIARNLRIGMTPATTVVASVMESSGGGSRQGSQILKDADRVYRSITGQ